MALSVIKKSRYVSPKLLTETAEEVFSYLDAIFEVNLSFISKDEIRTLNNRFRGINKPTNVLSFNYEKNEKDGDILICEEVVIEEAKELGFKESDLILLYLVHGILHLFGLDHQKKQERARMEKIEEFILIRKGIRIERD